jgi:guanylate kinase
MSEGTLFLISAPSGAGKTALVSSLLNAFSYSFALKKVITYTCRPARAQERQGYDYHFITPAEFEERITQGFFLEWSQSYGTYYGSPASIKEALAKGISLIMIVDRAGLASMLHLMPQAVRIWIEVPSLAILKERLLLRATDTPERIEQRLQLAVQEMEDEKIKKWAHHSLMNDNFDLALDHLKSLVLFHIMSPSQLASDQLFSKEI